MSSISVPAMSLLNPQWVARLSDFRPAWWLPGGHAQTLSAAYWTGHRDAEAGSARAIPLPDGDALVALDDCPASWQPGDPAILMMHGLGGSARNSFLVRVTRKLTLRGVRVFRLNLRSCGLGEGLARLPYNAGHSGDLRAAVHAVRTWCQSPVGPRPVAVRETPLTLLGISLSGNLLLKYLGEEGPHVPEIVVQSIAINPPIDLARSVRTLERPINRGYDRHFLRTLIEHVERQRRLRPDFAALPNPRPRSLFDFDDRFTAPHSGYADASTYYERASSWPRIPDIRCPTLILTATDDPLVPVEMFRDHQPTWPECLQLAITRGGGHLGYVGSGHGDCNSRWLDWRIVELVEASW